MKEKAETNKGGKRKLTIMLRYEHEFNELKRKYGRQGWWPIFRKDKKCLVYGVAYEKLNDYEESFRDPYFEIAVGAILTQNTAWDNVTTAVANLYKAKCLTPFKINKINVKKLQILIRPAGYFRQKTKALRLFSKWITKYFDGNLKNLNRLSIEKARSLLLAQWGIGKETADSILLYALNRPILVVDTYAKRYCKKYGIIFKEYDDYRKYFEKLVEKNVKSRTKRVKIYQELHAFFVAWGKENRQRIYENKH